MPEAAKKTKAVRKAPNPGQYLHVPGAEGDFLAAFIHSEEFQGETLKRMIPPGNTRPKSKKDAAAQVCDAFRAGTLSTDVFLREWVNQPRKWLSFKTGELEDMDESKLRDPVELLSGFEPPDMNAWYGPIVDGQRIWLVKPFNVKHLHVLEDGTLTPRPIRWHIFAEISDKYIALHWDGFNRIESEKKPKPGRFPYWRFLPPAWRQVEQIFPGTWAHPNLSNLVLTTLWAKYVDKPAFLWRHERVNGMARGISLSARASHGKKKGKGGARKQMQDLTGFSRQMARNILASTGLTEPTEEQLKKAENAGTHTMIHQWSPRSFEFSLSKKPNAGFDLTKDDHLCRAHCFFGTGPVALAPVVDADEAEETDDADDPSIDLSATEFTVQHIECYQTYASSKDALAFFLRELPQT